jgi:hypothetical protein
MCILCYGFAGESHWTETLGGDQANSRGRRREVAAAVLRCYGLELKGGLNGAAWVVSDRKGRSKVVLGLGELWPAAQELTGTRLDPLDPVLLEALGTDARSSEP